MNTDENSLETLLRTAPKPNPPEGLRQKLRAQIDLPAAQESGVALDSRSWLRRWWPALAPAAVGVACAAVWVAQQKEIMDLEAANQTLAETVTSLKAESLLETTPLVEQENPYQAEIERLTARASRLRSSVAELQRLQEEIKDLRALPATSVADVPEDYPLIEAARDKALRIRCVNNLKQFGLAVRMWAMEHNEEFAPDILSMSNELVTPKILYCPADTARQPALEWTAYSSSNCSYEYLAPSASSAVQTEPTRVLSRCPVHENVGLCDGSVFMNATDHPDWFFRQDGNLHFKPQFEGAESYGDPQGGSGVSQ